eukprot:1159218-Pelagomonas_calceolata.AAC.9
MLKVQGGGVHQEKGAALTVHSHRDVTIMGWKRVRTGGWERMSAKEECRMEKSVGRMHAGACGTSKGAKPPSSRVTGHWQAGKYACCGAKDKLSNSSRGEKKEHAAHLPCVPSPLLRPQSNRSPASTDNTHFLSRWTRKVHKEQQASGTRLG